VAPQGGVLEGSNPTVFDPKNPIILFIIQVHSPSHWKHVVAQASPKVLEILHISVRGFMSCVADDSFIARE
jgi:hypothetical protein